MAESPASYLTIENLDGSSDILTLTSRALPYRPVTFAGSQRVEFTWYPGSPVATTQMLGPEEQAITLQGFWKDRFLFGEGGSSPANYEASPIGTVRELTKVVDGMRRRGQLYRLTWDEIVRDGHITSFTQTWHNGRDCEWELEFTPISQGDQQTPVSFKNLPDVADYTKQTEDATNDARGALRINVGPTAVDATSLAQLVLAENPTTNTLRVTIGTTEVPISLSRAAAGAISDLDDFLLGAQNAVYDTAVQVADAVVAGPEAARNLVALAFRHIGQAQTAYGALTDRAWTGVFGTGANDPDDISIGSQVAMRAYQSRLYQSIRDFAFQQGTQAREILDTLNPELAAAFVAPTNMDLRDVSTQFYGSPDDWRILLIYNRFTTSKLTAGQLVWVPQRSNSSASNLTSGGY